MREKPERSDRARFGGPFFLGHQRGGRTLSSRLDLLSMSGKNTDHATKGARSRMSPMQRWLASGPVSDEAQDQLDRIVIGAHDESEQWARFVDKLTSDQREAFESLVADCGWPDRGGSDSRSAFRPVMVRGSNGS